MEVLGERLGEPVGERLDDDRAVVVVLGLEPACKLVGADAGGDRERAEVIARRGDIVGEATVRSRVAVVGLLAQEAEARRPRVGQHEVVAVRPSRPEPVHPPRT